MDDGTHGLREDRPPRPTPLGLAFGFGATWGLLGYSVLWEGVPFEVDRPFVQSTPGTLVLLPVRTVLWAIHVAERLADRSFDLSANHWWIAILAGAVGAAVAVAVWWLARAIRRRLRPSARAGFDTRR